MPNDRNYLKCAILLFCFCNATAQKDTVKDSSNIISFVDKIIVRVNMDSQTDNYSIKNDNDDSDFKIEPNNNYRLFLTLDYEFIGVSVGFAPKIFSGNDDDDLKGESSFEDYRFSFFLGKWLQNMQYRKIKGYHVKNTGDFLPGWEEGQDPYIQFPNLNYVTYGMSTSYVFNSNYSIRNLVYHSEKQKRSAGSFVPTLFYSYNPSGFSSNGIKSEENIIRIRFAPSYYYTFIIGDNWFVAANASPSLGVDFSKQKQEENNVTTKDSDTYFTRYLEGSMQIGYNSDRIVFGASFNFKARWYNESKYSAIENDEIYGALYFGYRFDAPKFVEKIFGKSRERVSN